MRVIAVLLRTFLLPRAALAAAVLALRHPIDVLQRSVKRPRLWKRDRIFWVRLSRLCADWRSSLVIVKPATVVRWHRDGFRLYWRWKPRKKLGRPKTEAEIRKLIRRMARENPTWGAPRIQSELAMLSYTVAGSALAKYMNRVRKPPSRNWPTFLENHVAEIAAIDFFVVPTVRFHGRLVSCQSVLVQQFSRRVR